MPQANYHIARWREPGSIKPDSYSTVTRHSGEYDKDYRVTRGRLKSNDEWVDQNFEYPAATWTEEQAHSHARKHENKDGRGKILEWSAATGEKKESAVPGELVRLMTGPIDDDDYLEIDEAAGELRNVSVISAGPALGHGFEIDETMLQQVVNGINGAGRGMKCRLTNPEAAGGFFTPGPDPIEYLVGRVRSARIHRGRVRANIRLSKFADDSPRGPLRKYLLGIAQEDPSIIGMSIVFIPDDFEEKRDAGGGLLATYARVKELKAVDFVGDPGANPDGLLSSKSGGAGTAAQLNKEAAVPPPDSGGQTMPEEKKKEEERPVDAAALAAVAAEKAKEATDAALKAERVRVAALRKFAKEKSIDAEAVDGWIERGVSLEKATELVELASKMKPVETRVSVGLDLKADAMPVAMCDAILLRAGVKVDKPHELSARYSRLSVLDMFRHWLTACGVPGAFVMSRPELVDLLNPRTFNRRFPGVSLAMGTSDFPNVLLDAQNKSMMQAYTEARSTWELWARRATAPDFKNINRIAISEAPDLVQRLEGGEYQLVALSDTREVYALAEYGQEMRLTRRALINDDMDAFGRIPGLQGAACRRLENVVCYGILEANANMADGVPLFNAAHANTVAVGGVIAVATLNAGRTAIRIQTGIGGATLDLIPAFLIVPPQQEMLAYQFTSPDYVPAVSGNINMFAKGRPAALATVTSAHLANATAWYLAASTSQIDTVEVCFLADEPQPVLKAETDFGTDDQRYVVRHTVAAKALDPRGLYRNPGA